MISFNSKDITFTLKNKSKLKTWIAATIIKTTKKPGDISFTFCSDSFLLNINKQYLNHDTYTDIITFDYSNNTPTTARPSTPLRGTVPTQQEISGDIFISIDRVKENAGKFSKSFEEELHRVMIHGVLHLLGYKDKSKIAKAEMRKQEDSCLKVLKKI